MDVIATIRRLPHPDREQREMMAEWEELAADSSALRRTAPAHFTASALPMTPDGRRVCLVLHRRLGLWVQPGGHLEATDESVAAAAAREMMEETGQSGRIDPAPLRLSRHPAPCAEGDWHLDLQMLAVADERSPTVSDESHAVTWFGIDALPGDLAPGVPEIIREGRLRLQPKCSSSSVVAAGVI